MTKKKTLSVEQQTIDSKTKKVIETKTVEFRVMPCRPGVCQECAVDHPATEPHNKDSLHYQYTFRAAHDRWPTWTDAIAHCDEATQERWKSALRELGVDI